MGVFQRVNVRHSYGADKKCAIIVNVDNESDPQRMSLRVAC